ncbi:MAG: geranylgeranyl reductase family protein [Actinobacteria bacterium]|nr:geranylgeranyl reductase family protein [Actinomycetota bacterium]
MKNGYDAVIVGAGPGGSSAAYFLASGGFRVLLLDKEVFPREKVCGDGITPRAVHSLQAMGVEEELAAGFRRTVGMRFFATHGGVTEVRFPMGSLFPDRGYVVPRRELDAILLRRAREAGVEVREGWRVVDLLPWKDGSVPGVVVAAGDERWEVYATYIVGADGPSSLVAGKLGLLRHDPRYLGVSMRCYMQGVRGMSDFLEIYPEDAISPACGWIFPLDGETANVGVGFMLYARERRRMNLNRVFESFCTRTRHAAGKLDGARPVTKPRGALLRVGMGGAVPRRANVVLVGDAASLTNPVSGEGIAYALESGRWAAEAIASALRGNDPGLLAAYPCALERHYGKYFRAGARAIRHGNTPWFINPLLFATSRLPRLGDKMGRFLVNCRRGEFPPRAPTGAG